MSLDEALLEYMRRIDAGEPVDREGLLSAHRDCAEELAAYLDWSEEVSAVLGPVAGDEDMEDLLLSETADTLELEARSLLELASQPGSGGGAARPAAPDDGPRLGASFQGMLIEEHLGGGRSPRFRARLGETEVQLRLFAGAGPLSGAARGRFERRCARWAEARHPALLPLLRFGVAGSGAWIAVPLCRGGDLLSRGCAGWPPARQARLLLALAQGLAAAHGDGLVHGALHPGVVLFQEPEEEERQQEDRPLLAEFDLGLEGDAGPGRDLAGGTALSAAPAYLSPEQARGAPVAPDPPLTASAPAPSPAQLMDVYGLGAILYYLLAGRAPYQGLTALDTRLLVVREAPEPPRSHRPQADPALEALCLRCLARDPGARPGSAAAVADALAELLSRPGGEGAAMAEAEAPGAAPPSQGALRRALRWLRG